MKVSCKRSLVNAVNHLEKFVLMIPGGFPDER